MNKKNKVALLGIIMLLIIIETVFMITKNIKDNQTESKQNNKIKPQEHIGIVIDELVKKSSDINTNIEGIKFLTEKEIKDKEFKEIKYNLFTIAAKLGTIKEYLPEFKDLTSENLEAHFVDKTLDELIEHSENKNIFKNTIRKTFNAKQELINRYLNYLYLNSVITFVNETEDYITVTIQSGAVLDSILEKKFAVDLAQIRNKKISDYLGVKSEYSADEYIIFEKNKEYEIYLYKLNKLPEIKANIDIIKSNLKTITQTGKKLDIKNINKNNKILLETQINDDIPITLVPIEYVVDKKTNKVKLNTRYMILYMKDIGKDFIITEQSENETKQDNTSNKMHVEKEIKTKK